MDKSIFIRADELAVELDVSKALAYKMINQWNEELKANVLTRKLNVSADRLYNDYGIRYESKRTHDGRTVCLTFEQPKA